MCHTFDSLCVTTVSRNIVTLCLQLADPHSLFHFIIFGFYDIFSSKLTEDIFLVHFFFLTWNVRTMSVIHYAPTEAIYPIWQESKRQNICQPNKTFYELVLQPLVFWNIHLIWMVLFSGIFGYDRSLQTIYVCGQ